jgi:hypothetical protein
MTRHSRNLLTSSPRKSLVNPTEYLVYTIGTGIFYTYRRGQFGSKSVVQVLFSEEIVLRETGPGNDDLLDLVAI